MSTTLDKGQTLEIRLTFCSNKFKTDKLDDRGKNIWKTRPLWVAQIIDKGSSKPEYVFLKKEGPMYAPKYGTDGTPYQFKQSFVIDNDGIYKAIEHDKFDKAETIEHVFTVKNGKIIEGVSRKQKSGADVSGGFSLETV